MFEILRGVGQHRFGRGTDADMGLLVKLRKFIEDECKVGLSFVERVEWLAIDCSRVSIF